VAASHRAAAHTSFTPALHRREPILGSHGFVLEPLRLIVILPRSGGIKDPNTLDSRLSWFGYVLTHGLWYQDMSHDYQGLGTRGKDVTVYANTVPAVTSSSTWGGYQDYVFGLSTNLGIKAAPSFETVYLLYLDCTPGETSSFKSCHGGGHRPFDLTRTIQGLAESRLFGSEDSLAVVTATTTVAAENFDRLTWTATHEVIEAATNPRSEQANGLPGWYLPVENPPWSGSPWSELQNGQPGTVMEVGDLGRISSQHIRLRFQCPKGFASCNSATPTSPEGHYVFARTYSPSAAQANGDPDVPPTPVPYYSSSTQKDWYRLPASGVLTVPVTAWSVTDSPPWTLSGSQLAGPGNCKLTGIPVTVRNGTAVNLGVKTTSPVTSGTWCVFELKSHRSGSEGSGATPDNGGDTFHSWVFGVYFP